MTNTRDRLTGVNTTQHAVPYVTDFDPSDTSVPEDRTVLSASMFDDYMRRVAAKKSPAGGYAKFRGSLCWIDSDGDDSQLQFRIDVDHAMSEGRTLYECMQKRARNARTSERVREAISCCGSDPDDWADAYESAARALQPVQTPRLYAQAAEHVDEVRALLRPVGKAHGVRLSVRKGRGSVAHAVMVSLTRAFRSKATPALRIAVCEALLDAGYESVAVLHGGMAHGLREHALFLARHYDHDICDFMVAKIVNDHAPPASN